MQIWLVSSRVGERMSASGYALCAGGGFSIPNSLVIIGSRKDAVLPLPVCAHAIRSRPAIEIGTVYFWIGVGFAYPASWMFWFSTSGRLSPAKSAAGGGASRPEVSTGMLS